MGEVESVFFAPPAAGVVVRGVRGPVYDGVRVEHIAHVLTASSHAAGRD